MESLVDIITIENLEQKMPRWDPTSSNHLYALVDMGSNGIRFSISDLSPPHTRLLKCVYRERAAISLFDALSGASLSFPDETIHLVSQTLARFRAIAIDDFGVPPDQVRVFATEAMRRAQNATAMLEAIRSASPDLSVSILAPQVETLFGSVGARSGFVDVKGLVLDLGGGSVQMTYLDTPSARVNTADHGVDPEIAAAVAGQSLPFGAARLIKVLDSHDADAQTTALSQLSCGLSEAFQTLCAKFPSLAAAAADARSSEGQDSSRIDIYLCGGGFRGYGSILMHTHPNQPYPIPSVGSFTVSGELFGRTKEMLDVNKSFDGKIFGMSKRRRAQFPAIVAVVDALIAAIRPIRSVTFCSGGNREGALMMSLSPEIRESSPLAHSEDVLRASVPCRPDTESATTQDVLNSLLSAFPPDLDLAKTTTIFGLQLGPQFVSEIWAHLGADADANASAALHNAISSPDQPGLTHLARAMMGVTLCARWGANLAAVDQQLHQNLRALMETADPDSTFWADYIGAVSAAMAMLVRPWPATRSTIKDTIKFRSHAEHGKKLKLHLEIFVNDQATSGVDLDDLVDLFKCVKKHKHDGKKVTVAVNHFSPEP